MNKRVDELMNGWMDEWMDTLEGQGPSVSPLSKHLFTLFSSTHRHKSSKKHEKSQAYHGYFMEKCFSSLSVI